MFFYKYKKKYEALSEEYDIEQFFGSIGRLVTSWAWLEGELDLFIIDIHRAFYNHIPESQIPVAFKKKIKFIRKAANSNAALEPYKDKILGLISKIEDGLEMRHDVIHGYISLGDLKDTSKISLMRVLRQHKKVPRYHIKEIDIKLLEILKEGKRIREIEKECKAISSSIDFQNLKNPIG